MISENEVQFLLNVMMAVAEWRTKSINVYLSAPEPNKKSQKNGGL